jgi:hypothetical protein
MPDRHASAGLFCDEDMREEAALRMSANCEIASSSRGLTSVRPTPAKPSSFDACATFAVMHASHVL